MVTLFWFRRDLRLDDNHALSRALSSGRPVRPIFIFDQNILDGLARDDARVSFIHSALERLHEDLVERGSGLEVHVGRPSEIFAKLEGFESIYSNEDYEPYAIARDREIKERVRAEFHQFKDHVVFGPNEIVKDDGSSYRVFTPYWRKWKASFDGPPKFKARGTFVVRKATPLPSLAEIGFKPTKFKLPPARIDRALLKGYAKNRDELALSATTKIGAHLRFGTISIREAATRARELSDIWLKELAWREFFIQVLFNHPHTASEPFDERFKSVEWRTDRNQFEAWSEGRTGYPIVDAGMRELNATGFMHNRARMITASFLTKHLLIDWRWGERYFASRLLDFELASNVGNWQWVAGSGCDAAPYFRIFNPALQAKRFDRKNEYVKRWIPELGTSKYPDPIVDHETARRRALVTLNRAVKGKSK